MGKISKGVACSVQGCTEKATKSISAVRTQSHGMTVSSNSRRAYLCPKHYKEFKKKTREERRVEKWRYME